MKTEQVCRTHNISAQTYYRWNKKYGGMVLGSALANALFFLFNFWIFKTSLEIPPRLRFQSGS